MAGQHRGDDLAGAGIHANVEFSPRPACLGAMLLKQPLAGATQLQARAVHQQMQGLSTVTSLGAAARPWPGHLQGPCRKLWRRAQDGPCLTPVSHFVNLWKTE